MRDGDSESTGRRLRRSFLQVFEPQLMTSGDATRTAAAVFEGHIGETSTELLLNAVLQVPWLLEYILSAISDEAFQSLQTSILSMYPVNPEDHVLSSLPFTLLARLFDPVCSLSPSSDRLRSCESSVRFADRVLQQLNNMRHNLAADASAETEHADEDLASWAAISTIKHGSQRARKQARTLANRPKKSRTVLVDDKVFHQYGLPEFAKDSATLEATARLVKVRHKSDLKYILSLLRPSSEDNVAAAVKKVYIRPSFTSSLGVEPMTGSPHSPSSETDSSTLINGEADDKADAPAAADGFGDWRILISTRADRNLREARNKDQTSFRIYIKKIKELSNGHFSDDNQKRLTSADIPVPIYEAKMTRDTRLVYQVDCVPEFDSDVERQVIRIFGIYTHAQLDKRFWNSMGYQLARKGKEYKARCTFRNQPRIKGDNVFSPASFPPIPENEPQGATFEMPTLRTEDLEELHSLLVLEKFVTFSQALLKSIVANQDIAHVFHVSPQEQQIIEHSYSCYVLGRSGTGKTTTMLFKMLGMENSWQQTRDMLPNRPRQLFVTQSRVLADKVEDYFMKLLESLNADVGTSGDIAEMLERKKNRDDAGLVDRDEAANWRDDLPKKFSDLKDAHFPMFITFDKLSAMLEADVEQSRNEASESATWAARHGDPADLPPSDYMQQDKQSFVSFNVFREAYWPHFPQNLTKGLDPSLVFSEFMGVIKGSEQALDSPDHALSQKAYLELSHRTQATFASRRAEIYDLFQAYTKTKRGRGDYDAADRTHSILEQLRTTGVMGNKMDFLYVDEVQDNLLIDARLLRTICRNPNGLFWAGDTAQTISVGSSFRFNDLKAFLHRFEESMQIKSSQKEAPQPKSFQLLTNYRSHGGIVQCAHSVIELITKFWPYAIDILAEEKGIVDGIKPVFFSGWDQDNVRYESFLFGAAGSHIEFGAQQCILVRDDKARERLRSQVGEIGLILTLYESKGLEFNDVLLYNFFEDSTLDIAQWRVILNALERGNRSKVMAPTFDENRHAGICTELKFLYVAITRARKNLWLVDRSDKCEPMRTYWMSKQLVQHCTPSTGIPHLAVASTPEEWASTAKTLFTRKRYYQAMHSYERAGKLREKEVAHAYYLREKARDKDADLQASLKEKKEAWSVAAEAFAKSAHEAIKERSEYFRIAADCYIKTEEHGKAAQAYANASMFTDAAKHYRKAGMFDDAVCIIQEHPEEVNESDADRIMNVARLYYFNRNDLKKAAGLFETIDEQLEFVTDYDLDVARAEILVAEQRFAEAASLHLEEGRTMVAVRLFLKDQDEVSKEHSLDKAKECLFNELWRHFSFDVVPDPDNLGDTTFKELLQLLAKSNLGSRDQREMQMFRFIKDRDIPQLLRLGSVIIIKGDNKLAAVLSLDHVFNDLNNFKLATMEETNASLQTFLSYVRLVQELINLQEPWISKVWLQRLYDSLKPVHHKFGSISNLNLQLVPEANRAFAVVKEWVRGHLYDLDPYKSPGFFAEVFKSVVLGFSFDNPGIREYVRRARCIQKRPIELAYAFRFPAGKYVVDDLLDFFEGYQKYSLDVGVIFLRHVSGKHVPMDAGVICDFMERVCAALIIRGHRDRVPFHNLCLPRSWILEFFREPNQLRKRGEEPKMIKSIVDVAGDVLKRLYTGQDADNLSYLGNPIPHERFIIRNIFISRIYVNAEGWNTIERTVMTSMSDSPLDEIVHLCAETEQVTHPASNPAPRQIRFKKFEDIPQLLSRDKAPVSVLRAEALAFIPRETVVDSPDTSPVLGQNEEDSFEELDGEVEPTRQVDVEAVIDSIDIGHTEVPTLVADEERTAAASNLQYYYRQLVDRRRSSEKTGPLSRVYAACLEASLQVSAEWKPKSHYRFVFLGALPHLLLCIEWLSSTAQANKVKIKKKVKKAKHQDLDDLMDYQTSLNKLIKEVKSTQQVLEPRSDFHQRRDLEGLKPYVAKIEELLGRLPGSEEARPDFDLAWKWIVKERTVKKVEKPSLNTDDLEEEL
ncbi:hypothetical protein EWM64_g7674 [Hericium alpestre]|uniref:UvrD-like helicase ATP-binding domain-containing protein n=1 Tax=Hericium alpestre TaxID=135208 RepID=A0A4Y9ZQK0_9AGAM|nr:hypothetical protein EWM64_g7674 [Hericium alpestre]